MFSKQFPDIGFGMAAASPASARCPEACLGPRGRYRSLGPPERALPRLLRPARARLGDPRRRRLPGQGRARAQPPLRPRQFRGRPALCQRARLPAPARQLVRAAQRRVHRTTRAVVSDRLAQERAADALAARAAARTQTAASSSRVPPSPTCASTATTTRSTRASSAAASRSASRRPSSPRSARLGRALRPPPARLRRRALLHRSCPSGSARRAARRAPPPSSETDVERARSPATTS